MQGKTLPGVRVTPKIAEDITQLVGATPMLHMSRLMPAGAGDVFAKLEYLNPGGSIKDRAAIGIIKRAEEQGLLHAGSTIIEATAGNTGIGLALIGVNRGYRVIFCVPERFSEEKVKIMHALGAEVLRTPDADGMLGAISKAKEMASQIPGSFTALQFENQANPDYHYETTAPEIWEQMEGRIDAIVVGIGTGGTFSGIARFMKEKDSNIRTVAVESQGSILQGGAPGPHKVEGIGVSFIPKTYHPEFCDEVIMVQDEDAFQMVKDMARKEGVLGGSSSGANVFAAMQVAMKLGVGKRVAVIIADSAERYMSKKIFEGGV